MQTPPITVSFVVPLFNCLALTQAMFASLETTLPGDLAYEVIFVDDGSTDGTVAWLKSLRNQRIQFVVNASNSGYAASNNRGAALARGAYLALLNNDLVLTPGWLEPILEAHQKLGQTAGVIGNIQRAVATGEIDHSGIYINAKAKPQHDRSAPSRLSADPFRPVAAVTGACMFLRLSLWNALGGFDELFKNGCEDVDLCFRAAAAGHINAVAVKSQVFHHVSSSFGRKLRDEQNTLRLILKWRDQLATWVDRNWALDFLSQEWTSPRDPSEAISAAEIFLYAFKLRRSPPRDVEQCIHWAITRELTRWRSMGLTA